MDRPALIPGLPRVWRAPAELQLGADPVRAVLLRLPEPRTAEVLDLLDGTRLTREVLLQAADRGIPPPDTRALLDNLRLAGLLLPVESLLPPGAPARLLGEASALALSARPRHDLLRHDRYLYDHHQRERPSRDDQPTPAGVLRRRAESSVIVSGRGRLGAGVAVALAESGVGHVRAELPGPVHPGEVAGGPLRESDAGRARSAAVTEAVIRAAPGTATHSLRRATATLLVQLDQERPTGLVAAVHARRRQPHLAVALREGTAVIGPFVPAAGAPCLHCLDLHRRDRDPEWPGLPRSDGPEPCSVTTLLAATAYATAEALAFLDGGDPETLGASVEIVRPGAARRRSWPPHPDCFCFTG